MSDTEDPGGGADPPPQQQLCSIDKLTAHVTKVALAVLEEDPDRHAHALSSLLATPTSQETLGKFISDHHRKSLLVDRCVVGKGEDEDEDGGKAAGSGAGSGDREPEEEEVR